MTKTTLIVPGLHNSGPDQWQTWIQTQIPGATRVEQDDWKNPQIRPWAQNVERAFLSANRPVFIIAHSFGVLASIMGAANLADQVSGALFVAPADPSRFTVSGERINQDSSELDTGLYHYIPKEHLGYPSFLAASMNDYCMPFKRTAWWSKVWGNKLICLGNAGHVNAHSGYDKWPFGLNLYQLVIRAADRDESKWPQFATWAF